MDHNEVYAMMNQANEDAKDGRISVDYNGDLWILERVYANNVSFHVCVELNNEHEEIVITGETDADTEEKFIQFVQASFFTV